MTREQLDALELWIISIINDMDRASDITDAVHRGRRHERILEVFGLKEPSDGN